MKRADCTRFCCGGIGLPGKSALLHWLFFINGCKLAPHKPYLTAALTYHYLPFNMTCGLKAEK
jgi:hypothetical protein